MRLALPILIAVAGVCWMYGALTHYQRATGRELQGLVGYHYSVPESGFRYAPDGAHIERWSFHIPAIATFVLLLGSACVGSVRNWRRVGTLRTLAFCAYHVACAAAFCVVYVLLWIHAASVFI